MSIIDNLKGECMSYTDFDFPHTSLYTSDLRELIANLRRLEDIVKTFVNTEQIKFADPIIWNITSQYAKTTVVLDTEGNAYLSKQAVPSGIQLNNEEYWQEIFNFTNYTRTANQNLTVNEERNTTRATHSYVVDDWLIWNDVLYKVTSPIAIDDALVVGTNLVHFTIEDFIKAWITYATNLINQYKDDIDASELAYRQQLARDIEAVTLSLQTQLDEAIAGATVDSEVINARIGANDITYSSLGNAIRTQVEILNSQIDTLDSSVYVPGTTNLYTEHSQEMLLAINTTSFSQGTTLYGFFIKVDPDINTTVTIKRKNIGARFRAVATQAVPAVGVTYDASKQIQADNNNILIYNQLDSDDNYIYIAFYSSSVDTITKEQALEGMTIYYGTSYTAPIDKIARLEVNTTTDKTLSIVDRPADANAVGKQLFIPGVNDLFDNHTFANLQFDFITETFASAIHGKGFYVPIDTTNGDTITIERKYIGARFRCATSASAPAVGVAYTHYNVFDTSRSYTLTGIEPTEKYLYILFYNDQYDTLTEEQCLENMHIYYGTEFKSHESIIGVLTDIKDVHFVNGNIDTNGSLVSSSKHITSDFIRVNGKFGVSCPSDYLIDASFYEYDGTYSHKTTYTNRVSYLTQYGFVRFTISASDNSDVTPSTVDFSQIKMVTNRYSAKSYADKQTFVLDAENCLSSDVYDYIDSVVTPHSLYASKTLLCTESSGLPIYYYTLGTGSKKLCIVSGQHGPSSDGDPRDSVITVAKLTHDLITGNFNDDSFLKTLHDDYTIIVIPILNVYGFNNRTRTDANGDDTNRDWTTPTTIEVAAAKALIAGFNPSVALDVHCNGTTPLVNPDIEIQFGIGSTHNPIFKAAVQNKFKSYYNTDVATRTPNTTDTLQYYIINTLGALGGLIEMRWWLKNTKWFHDYQTESTNYAMIVNLLKYCNSVLNSTSYIFEKTPNQNQY